MGAIHGSWCNAKTIPMTCKCNARIFWFSCECGSSILFDELGAPWPIHRCDGFKAKPTLSRLGPDDLSGSMLSYLDKGTAEEISRLLDAGIEAEYVNAVQKAKRESEKRPKRELRIVRQDSYQDCRTCERGTVMEIIRDANIRKKAGVAAEALGVAMLGKFALIPLVQITIHTMALAEDESENSSFTFFVAESIVDKLQIYKGCPVVAELRGIVINPRFPIWVCDQLSDSM